MAATGVRMLVYDIVSQRQWDYMLRLLRLRRLMRPIMHHPLFVLETHRQKRVRKRDTEIFPSALWSAATLFLLPDFASRRL